MLAPLFLLGILAIAWRLLTVTPTPGVLTNLFTHLALGSLLAVLPWLVGGYGGADAKAALGLALVTGNVWALVWILTAACAVAGVWYIVRSATDSAPFLVGVFVGTVSLVVVTPL